MKNIIKNSMKVFLDYLIIFIVFTVFGYPFLSIAKDSFSKWLPAYSIFMFLILSILIYTEMRNLAEKEKRPQYDLNPYPLKGLIYGAIGVIPVAFPMIILLLLRFDAPLKERVREVSAKILMGPVFFIIRWFKGELAGYGVAILLIPMIAMLGYLAGHYDFNILEILGRKAPAQEKAFVKSPWNPTNVSVKSPDKKKKGPVKK